MDKLAEALDRLDRLRCPSDVSFDREGTALAATVRPVSREKDQSYQSRIWRFGLDGTAKQLTDGPNGDALPRYSPVDGRLAFISDRNVKGKADLFILDQGVTKPLGTIPGTIEYICWTSEGAAIVVLAADRGLDGGATNGAKRLTWGDEEDPAVNNPTTARRRLFKVDSSNGATTEVGPVGLSVWEFHLLGDSQAVALVSDDPSEGGWYHSRIARVDFATRTAIALHRSEWQLQRPSPSPSGKKVAFTEGWSSDRGLVASEVRVLDLASGKVTTVAADRASDVTTFKWLDEDSLWFAGWSKLGTIYGVAQVNGTVVWSKYEDAIIGANSFSAQICPAPDKTGFAAVRETVGDAPEIVFKASADAKWRPVTRLNAAISEDFDGYPEVRTLRWKGFGGLELDGLVLLPHDRQSGLLPMIIDIHGGPSWTAKYAFNPGYALPLAAAGYAVFLPNYRGNTGWGQDFAKLNIGDPGGAEFQDILLGIDMCIAEGLADSERLGVTGASYGGYMTAWAVATTNRFKAAVMVSGIANQLSSHYACNHDFHAFINGGPLTDPRNRQVALDRSPLMRLDKPTTPTLILHGVDDRCTPLGQAQEFYAALVERGVPTELVVYPREGHGFQERGHRRDATMRTVAWFDRHLGKDR
jgi:dipeptidyl aminopeptidase/acylaminoacyl peptidase